jgi:hypothetical protein
MAHDSAKFFVVNAPDAAAVAREIEAEVRSCGLDPAREGADLIRYFQPPAAAVGEVYVAERAARALEERGLRPGVLRYAVPGSDVPAQAQTLLAPAGESRTLGEPPAPGAGAA